MHTRTVIFVLVCSLVACSPARSNVWTQVPLPADASYVTAMTCGFEFLYASARDANDEDLGLFRTSLPAAGSWEYLGFQGHPIWGLLVVSGGSLRNLDQMILVAAAGDTVMFRSEDGGMTWHRADLGFAITPPAAGVELQ